MRLPRFVHDPNYPPYDPRSGFLGGLIVGLVIAVAVAVVAAWGAF